MDEQALLVAFIIFGYAPATYHHTIYNHLYRQAFAKGTDTWCNEPCVHYPAR